MKKLTKKELRERDERRARSITRRTNRKTKKYIQAIAN